MEKIAYIEKVGDNNVVYFNKSGAKIAKVKCRKITAKRMLNGLPYKDMDKWIEQTAKMLTDKGIGALIVD